VKRDETMSNVKAQIKPKAQMSNPRQSPFAKGGQGRLLIDFGIWHSFGIWVLTITCFAAMSRNQKI
jgi:hypothetical protein